MFKCHHCNSSFSSAIKFKKHGRNPCSKVNHDLDEQTTMTSIAEDILVQNVVPQDDEFHETNPVTAGLECKKTNLHFAILRHTLFKCL